MAARKRAEPTERKTVTVTYRVVPYFAVVTDDPALSGTSGVGSTAKEALAHMRARVRSQYPLSDYDIVERADDRQLFLATSWREPVYE